MSLSSQFKLMYLCETSAKNEDDAETARRFWNVLEHCCSLYAAGWVGEAGAMAIASEAIGLGISRLPCSAPNISHDEKEVNCIKIEKN